MFLNSTILPGDNIDADLLNIFVLTKNLKFEQNACFR